MMDIMESQHRYFVPSQYLSVDEGMIKYKGRLSFLQYMPAKPTKYGIKFYSCCDSVTGYCLRLVIYVGRENRFNGGEGFVYNIVNYLLQRYYLKNYICFTDNFYTSLKLALHLISQRTHLCGTIRKNSRGFPKLERRPLLRGDNIKLANAEGIVACHWWDKHQVYYLSTCTDGHDVQITRLRGEISHKPHQLHAYNASMGGVDKSDQLRSYFRVGRPSIKWWKTCFNGLLNITIINSYVLYCQKIGKIPIRDYKFKLAAELQAGYNSRKRPSTTQGPSQPSNKFKMDNHIIVKSNSLRLCVQCKKVGRKTPSLQNIRTLYYCQACDVFLCSKSGST